MYHVYVLKSKRNGKRYTGFTRKSATQRLKEHNCGGSNWTRYNGPFDLIYSEEHASRKAALKQEKYLKTAAGRKYLNRQLDL